MPRGKRAKRDAREPSTEPEYATSGQEEEEEEEEDEEEEKKEGEEEEEEKGEEEEKEEEEEASQSDAENNGDTCAPEESGVSMPRRSLRKINSKGKEKEKTVEKEKEKKPTTKKAEAKDAGKVGKEGKTGKAKDTVGKEGKTGKAKDTVGKEGKTGKAKDTVGKEGKTGKAKDTADKASNKVDKAEADKSGSASWTDDMTTTLVRKMLDMKRKGRQSDNGWKTGAWKEACDIVNDRYDLHLTVTQVKNKMTAVWPALAALTLYIPTNNW
jgi:hypothetical protein